MRKRCYSSSWEAGRVFKLAAHCRQPLSSLSGPPAQQSAAPQQQHQPHPQPPQAPHAQQHAAQQPPAQQQQQQQHRVRREDENSVVVCSTRYTKLECVGRGGSSKVTNPSWPHMTYLTEPCHNAACERRRRIDHLPAQRICFAKHRLRKQECMAGMQLPSDIHPRSGSVQSGEPEVRSDICTGVQGDGAQPQDLCAEAHPADGA